jgi:threonine dehydrogenase-like Zn-dependent dehydrogenase
MEKPIAKDGETLLKIERIGICGTDLHAFEGTQPFFSYPRILGHELAATIIDTNAKGFLPNEAVTIIPYFSCGKCIACRMNNENCCSSINVFGVHIDGGMREFVVVPDEYLVKSEGLDFDELALVEPLSISAHGVRRAVVKKDEFADFIAKALALSEADADSLTKANKTALAKIADFIRAEKA